MPQAGWGYTGVGLGFFPGSLLTGGRLGRLPARPLLSGTAAAQALALPAGRRRSTGGKRRRGKYHDNPSAADSAAGREQAGKTMAVLREGNVALDLDGERPRGRIAVGQQPLRE